MANRTTPTEFARELSPRRNTTRATSVEALVEEQLRHFAIDPASAYGHRLGALAANLYFANVAAHELWQLSLRELANLDQRDRVVVRGARHG